MKREEGGREFLFAVVTTWFQFPVMCPWKGFEAFAMRALSPDAVELYKTSHHVLFE
jgi:hypothetical protein